MPKTKSTNNNHTPISQNNSINHSLLLLLQLCSNNIEADILITQWTNLHKKDYKTKLDFLTKLIESEMCEVSLLMNNDKTLMQNYDELLNCIVNMKQTNQ